MRNIYVVQLIEAIEIADKQVRNLNVIAVSFEMALAKIRTRFPTARIRTITIMDDGETPLEE